MLAAHAAPPTAIIDAQRRTDHASPNAALIARTTPQIRIAPPKHRAVQASELATPWIGRSMVAPSRTPPSADLLLLITTTARTTVHVFTHRLRCTRSIV